MAKRHLKKALSSLTADGFNEFCDALVDNTSIQVASVEGKGRLEIATLMVNTFTEDEAVKTAVEILKEISCNKIATDLAKDAGVGVGGGTAVAAGAGVSTGAGVAAGAAVAAGVAAGAPQPDTRADEAAKHFVDEHMEALIQRVSNISSILDALMTEQVITQEYYNKINTQGTCQDKMRMLFAGPLYSSNTCKDIFLKILQKEEKCLIEDL